MITTSIKNTYISFFYYYYYKNSDRFPLNGENWCGSAPDCRKTKEMRLIHALGTLNPHGINERFTFCLPSVVPEPFCLFNNFFSPTSLSFYFLLFFYIPISLRYLAFIHRFTYLYL